MKSVATEIAETLFPALCRAVVVDAKKIDVKVKHGAASSSISVDPEQEEAGNLIGKHGRIIRSFVLLSQAVGERHSWPVRYGVETEPGANPPQKERTFELNKVWNAKAANDLLNSTLSAFLVYPAQVSTLVNSRRRTSYEVVLNEEEPVLNVSLEERDKPVQLGDDAICAALNNIFESIGRLCGRTVTIAYVRKSEPKEPQPKKADGRYTKELS